MDGRLPAQHGRPLQVAAPLGLGELLGQAAVVDPLGASRPLQRPVCFLFPDLAGLCNPVRVHQLPGFQRPAALRIPLVGSLEPRLGAAGVAVQAALRDHQVRVGVVLVAGVLRLAPVDGERIGKPLSGPVSFSAKLRARTTRPPAARSASRPATHRRRFRSRCSTTPTTRARRR